jgi:hypothetical protein
MIPSFILSLAVYPGFYIVKEAKCVPQSAIQAGIISHVADESRIKDSLSTNHIPQPIARKNAVAFFTTSGYIPSCVCIL